MNKTALMVHKLIILSALAKTDGLFILIKKITLLVWFLLTVFRYLTVFSL